jgi:hypothetical protein
MKVNEMMMKDLKEATKIDPDTGKYTNAQKVGINFSIGIATILSGILFLIGGISLVFWGIITSVAVLIILSIIIYLLVKLGVV